MRTAASANPEPAELTYGTFNGFAYMPAMPGIAYRVRDLLVGTQEPGGRCLVTEEEIAKVLGVHRSLVGRGLQHLILAKIVFRETKGVYLLNPMISGFRTIAEHLDAIAALAPEDRLDVDDFQERYDEAVTQAEREKLEKRLERERGAPRRKPAEEAVDIENLDLAVTEKSAGVLDLAAARRRPRRKTHV